MRVATAELRSGIAMSYSDDWYRNSVATVSAHWICRRKWIGYGAVYSRTVVDVGTVQYM